MKIDLTIGWDDLSKECKEQIKNLKTLGYDVQLHYPTIAKKGIEWAPYDSGISISPSDYSQLITTCKTSNTAGNSSGGI